MRAVSDCGPSSRLGGLSLPARGVEEPGYRWHRALSRKIQRLLVIAVEGASERRFRLRAQDTEAAHARSKVVAHQRRDRVEAVGLDIVEAIVACCCIGVTVRRFWVPLNRTAAFRPGCRYRQRSGDGAVSCGGFAASPPVAEAVSLSFPYWPEA